MSPTRLVSVLRVASGPRVRLASCKSALNPPVVCSTDRSKALVPVLVLLFVALWFILRGDLLYVFPCVIMFLCFSVLLVLRLPRLGRRELIWVLFVRLFGLYLFGFVGFLFLLGSGKGFGLWLWHSLDFSLTFFCTCLVLSVSSSFWCLGRAAVCNCGTRLTFLLAFFLVSLDSLWCFIYFLLIVWCLGSLCFVIIAFSRYRHLHFLSCYLRFITCIYNVFSLLFFVLENAHGNQTIICNDEGRFWFQVCALCCWRFQCSTSVEADSGLFVLFSISVQVIKRAYRTRARSELLEWHTFTYVCPHSLSKQWRPWSAVANQDVW